ncbi:hypothetical protein QN277_028255 [Acacia crassicarpa]|uniref:Uncharacterized protein n=1 Tax=Acacia crassicarpa TaxID=499986 RepID=A0AAE1K382_9FABA|nr:hypothetical protein QN277_028255 [Acacia crassicarpa]
MWELEIRVLSCEGLNLISHSSSSSSFSWWSSFSFLRPPSSRTTHYFVSVTKLPDQKPKVYSGRLHQVGEGAGEGEGGVLRVPADSSFLSDTQSCLYLEIYEKRRILGPTQVGWCLVPALDIGPPPPPHPSPSVPVRCLSYRLRGRDGCVGSAIINLSIQLKDTCEAAPPVVGIPIGTMEEGHVKFGC